MMLALIALDAGPSLQTHLSFGRSFLWWPMVSLWNRTGFSFSRIRLARLSAAKARLSHRAPREKPTVWERVAQALATGWKLLATVVLSLAGVFTFAITVVFLWQALTQKTIAIAPISVPRTLAENGYTADVAAQRLHDALNKVVEDANSRKNGPGIALQADLPSIVVPTIGLSLETIAADIRTSFRISGRWNISGELTLAQKQLWLRLRMNGRDFYSSPNGVDPERPDELLVPAAEKVFEEADPFVAAASLSERDPGKCLEKARHFIANLPETDPSVPWTHNLIGYVLYNQHKTEEAIAEYRNAIVLDPRFAAAYDNLGYALSDQHKTEEAIAEYRKAIELDPRFAGAYNNLGTALSDQGKTEEAIAEYRKAIELDPRLALAHYNLAIILRAQYKTEEAITEYRKAIEFGPRDAWPHNGLGNVLLEQGNTEEAIAEYRKTIELDPGYALPHHNLANILRAQGKIDEADVEEQKAKELGAKHPD